MRKKLRRKVDDQKRGEPVLGRDALTSSEVYEKQSRDQGYLARELARRRQPEYDLGRKG